MKFFKKHKIKRDTKRVFLKKGTCSRTFFYLLNREFGFQMNTEEQAADPLAGGIVQQGYQCGMIWGASLALGAESYRRTDNPDEAVNMAIEATRHVLRSFTNRTSTTDCMDITEIKMKNKWSVVKFMVKGKMFTCFRLADKWAPEAFKAAQEGLSLNQSGLPKKPVSCASEVVKKMGGSERDAAIVAGLAGGVGLCGGGCGALGAAVWKSTLERIKKGEYKYTMSDKASEKLISEFYKMTEYKMECSEITGKKFETVKNHTDYINSGGCKKVIETIVRSAGTFN